MSKRSWQLSAAAIALAVICFWYFSSEALPVSRPQFLRTTLILTRADGAQFFFNSEVANSRDEQAYGLMFLKSLPEDEGMIFPYDPPQEVSFWMKNTLIPLDMLFVRPDGTIGSIVEEATPLDLTPISSQVPVSGVIEIKGGMAKKDGLAVGDKVVSPALKVTP